MLGYPLLTDENVDGPIIEGLRNRGWDVMHATEEFGEKTEDVPLFEYAAKLGRVMVSTDQHMLNEAYLWLEQGHAFRLIWWLQEKTQRIRTSIVLDAFEAIATKPDAFAFPIEYLELPRSSHGPQLK